MLPGRQRCQHAPPARYQLMDEHRVRERRSLARLEEMAPGPRRRSRPVERRRQVLRQVCVRAMEARGRPMEGAPDDRVRGVLPVIRFRQMPPLSQVDADRGVPGPRMKPGERVRRMEAVSRQGRGATVRDATGRRAISRSRQVIARQPVAGMRPEHAVRRSVIRHDVRRGEAPAGTRDVVLDDGVGDERPWSRARRVRMGERVRGGLQNRVGRERIGGMRHRAAKLSRIRMGHALRVMRRHRVVIEGTLRILDHPRVVGDGLLGILDQTLGMLNQPGMWRESALRVRLGQGEHLMVRLGRGEDLIAGLRRGEHLMLCRGHRARLEAPETLLSRHTPAGQIMSGRTARPEHGTSESATPAPSAVPVMLREDGWGWREEGDGRPEPGREGHDPTSSSGRDLHDATPGRMRWTWWMGPSRPGDLTAFRPVM